MTDNEIIRCLSLCRAGDCENCKALNVCDATFSFHKDALNLINRQKAEIEMLKDELHCAKVEISKHFDYMDEATNEYLDVFADSLKIKLNRTIDNLVKEMKEVNEDDRA